MFKPRLRLSDGRLPATIAGSLLLLSLPAAAGPGGNSLAEVGACLEDAGIARVCSTKELSNVVVQCGDESGSFFVKYDELDDGTYEGLTDPYSGSFACPSGDVIAVFIKSGNNRYDGTLIEGLPPGSGALWTPLACGEESAECGTPDEGGGDENAGENTDTAD